MKKQKMEKTVLMMFLIAALIISPTFADVSISQVSFANPLQIGSQQIIQAYITSNITISLVNIEINDINYSMTLNNEKYEYAFTPLDQGTKSFKIYAIDNQSLSSTYQSTFIIKDLTIPIITTIAPGNQINSDTAELKISTDENSTCKYDTINNSYSLMSNFFSNTGSLLHQTVLIHLPSGIQTYYLSCKDSSENIGYGSLTFSVIVGPSAQITLSQSSPLKADTYKVRVITTKPLASTPILQYKYDDEQKYYQVSLIGQDNSWEGYLVISPDSKDRIGTFTFQGLDYDGLIGTKISDGSMFIVDTIKPISPASINAISKDGEVEVSWFYDGEDPERFNIYRSTVPGVEYTDYYDDDKKTPFEDSGVEDQKDYYYRIAAVDKAGNVGELSSEKHILFEDTQQTKETSSTITITSEKLSSSLEKKLNETYSSVKSLKFDISYALSQLQSQTDRFKSTTISELKIIENAKSADLNADNILSEMDNIRSQDLSDPDFNEKLQNINDKVNKIKSDVISQIVIVDSLEFTQSSTQSDLSSAINEVFLRKELEENSRENYTHLAASYQDTSNIFETIIIAKLTSLGNGEQYVTLVTKEISSPQTIYDAILLENIPKTFSETSKNLIFSENPVILKDDPIIYWSSPKLETTKLSYYIYEKKDISDVKDAKTLILPDPSKFIPKKGVYAPETSADNQVTGNLIFDTTKLKSYKEYLFIALGILVISGLLVYYFFFINDSGFDNDDYDDIKIQAKNTNPNLELEISKLENNAYSKPDEKHENHDEKHLLNLIEHAEIHANNLNTEQAAKEYALIFSFFNSTKLNTQFQSKVIERITNLHKKINIKKKIDASSNNNLKIDKKLIERLLSDIKATKESFSSDEKHPLKNYLQAYHDYYSLILSNTTDKEKKN